MFKILLIHPYCTHHKDSRLYPLEPLGLLSLATYLNREIKDRSLDIQTKILDTQLEGPEHLTDRGCRSGMTDDQIRCFLNEYEPDLVGITNNYTNLTGDVLELSKTIKETCPNCCLILGGAHATIDHYNLIKLPDIDAVVRSEGEETFKEVVFALHNKTGFENIAGLTYKAQGRIQVNPDRPRIKDINTLPIPDRSLIPYEKYLAHSRVAYSNTMNQPIATIFTARGCPFRCIFCSTQKVWGNEWRARNPEKILEEIEYLMGTYSVKEVSFEDDQFIGDRNRVKNLCRLIIQRKLNITFIVPPGISPALLDEETLDLMQKAGFYRICFSIDVGTPAAQRYVRKPIKLERMRALIRRANSNGLWTYATFVIGFLNETVEDIHQTIAYAYSLRLDGVIFYIAQPHLGSELYDVYLKEGLIDEKIIQSHHSFDWGESLFGTKHISAAEMEALRNSAARGYFKCHLQHFLNPVYVIREFLPKISSPRKLAYFARLLFHIRDYS